MPNPWLVKIVLFKFISLIYKISYYTVLYIYLYICMNIILDFKYKKCISLSFLGLSHTDHYEEIAADSMDKIYKLIYNTYKALEHRGNPDLLQIHLAEIPPAFHNRLNYLAQYGCQVPLFFN